MHKMIEKDLLLKQCFQLLSYWSSDSKKDIWTVRILIEKYLSIKTRKIIGCYIIATVIYWKG